MSAWCWCATAVPSSLGSDPLTYIWLSFPHSFAISVSSVPSYTQICNSLHSLCTHYHLKRWISFSCVSFTVMDDPYGHGESTTRFSPVPKWFRVVIPARSMSPWTGKRSIMQTRLQVQRQMSSLIHYYIKKELSDDAQYTRYPFNVIIYSKYEIISWKHPWNYDTWRERKFGSQTYTIKYSSQEHNTR